MKTTEQADKEAASAISFLKISMIAMDTYKNKKSKKNKMTEAQLKVILERAFAERDQPVQDIKFEPAELEYDSDLDVSLIPFKRSKSSEAPSMLTASKVSTSGSVSISIRIPSHVVNAFKAMALEKCVGYQTLMNRQLRLVLAGS